MNRVASKGATRFGLGKTVEIDLVTAASPKPPFRPKGLPAQLGGGTKNVGPPNTACTLSVTQRIRDLPKSGTGDTGRAVDVIDEAGDIVENEWEVGIELALNGGRERARGWSLDVCLIH